MDRRVEKVVSPESIRWIERQSPDDDYFDEAWRKALAEARSDLAQRLGQRKPRS